MHAYRTTEFMHGREALKQEARVDIFENQPTNQTQTPTTPFFLCSPCTTTSLVSLFSNKKQPANFAFFFYFFTFVLF